MNMDKCCVVVFSTEGDCPPDKMTPQMMHALVRARETHIRYKSYVGTLTVQLTVTAALALASLSLRGMLLGVLVASMLNAACCGIAARARRRHFEKLSRE